MDEENMILEEQQEQESTVDEVQTNEEQTEQDSSSSLDDILAGVNELLEQSASYNAYLEENQSEPQSEIIAFDNGNAVEVSDLDAIAVQAANSSVYPGTWSGSILDYFSGVMRQNPGKHYVAYNDLTRPSDSDVETASGTLSDTSDVTAKTGLFTSIDNLTQGVFNLFTNPGATTLTFPGFGVEIDGVSYDVWADIKYNLSDIDDKFGGLMSVVRFASSLLVYLALIRYLINTYHRIFGEGE